LMAALKPSRFTTVLAILITRLWMNWHQGLADEIGARDPL